MRPLTLSLVVAGSLLAVAGCGDDDSPDSPPARAATSTAPAAPAGPVLDRVVKIDGARGLYVRCTGSGSPTVVMEGGDGDTSDSYAFAERDVSRVTRTCVYDRANLGRSDPAPGPRGLPELTGDLDRLLEVAKIPGPYVLVGTSGGGFITAGYAAAHPREIAGLVFVDTGAPLQDPPREIVEATAPDHPENVEKRDFLEVERDAWSARRRIGDIPVTIMTVRFSASAIEESPFPAEQRAMRRNVQRQQGWRVLSPRAEQVVVSTGHAVEEEDPELVIDAILDVVRAAR